MCHHYLVAEDLPEGFVFAFSLNEDQREVYRAYAGKLKNYGAWPLKPLPAIRIDLSDQLEIFSAEWGLLPRWWKPSDKAPKRSSFQRKTINARSETVHEKPTYREAFAQRRCLLPMNAFQEKGHYFGLSHPIALAGLWETWQSDTEPITTCTLLTTEPNAEVQAVGHHRMPVLLTTPESREQWLTEGLTQEMARPLADGLLTDQTEERSN